MESNSLNVDALYIHALCVYHMEWEQAIKCFQSVIALDPEHKRAKAMILKVEQFQEQKQLGKPFYCVCFKLFIGNVFISSNNNFFFLSVNKLFDDEKYREAIEKITELLDISPHSDVPKLLHQRAITNFKTAHFRDAISDCSAALETSNVDYLTCLRLRADCYMAMRKFQSAVTDYEELFHEYRSSEADYLLRKAKRALERFRSDNYYDVLDVNRTASTDEIKKSFKKLALIHHPDKHADASNDEKIEQQNQFKKISIAHEVLSNTATRGEYDRKIRKQSYFY